MGEIDRDGCLRITGRVKDLFKTSKGGKYVVPVPIENRFNHPPKAEVVCVAGANQPPQPCLMVLLSEEARDELERGGAVAASWNKSWRRNWTP